MNKTLSLVIAVIMQLCGIMQLPCEKSNIMQPADSINGGDPFVVTDGDNTYYTFTTGGGIDIFKINSIDDFTVTQQKTVYFQGADSILGEIWAPEIHKIGNKWYIVASALFDKATTEQGTMPDVKNHSEHSDYYRYGFVLESKTDDIFGEYEFKTRLAPNGMNNIDGTYLKKDGKLYYVCSAYLKPANQCISITEMENPYTLKTDKAATAVISKPLLPFEQKGWHVNEAPAVLYKNNTIHIIYSASGYSSGNYCLGMLTLTGDNVLCKTNWIKSPMPVFAKSEAKGIYHTGHCCFVTKNNEDIYMVFHATSNEDFFAENRHTYVKKIEFFKDYPLFNQ